MTTTEPKPEATKDDGHGHRRRRDLRGAAGRAADQGRAGARRLHPALLLARAHEAGRHVPHVPRRGRGRARACRPRAPRPSPTAWSCNTQSDAVKTDPGRRARVPAHQPPARLPGVRPRRRVPAAGPDARVRSGRVALRRGEAPLREADPDQRPRAARPRALHPVRPLHALRRRDRRRPADRLRRPRRPHRGHHLPRRSRSPRTSRGNTVQICPVGALTAEARTASRPGRGTSRRSRRRAPRARCSAAARCSRRRTGSCGCSASTPSPVNQGWLCDKGRYGFECGALRATACVDAAWCASDGELVEVSWPEALDAAADGAPRRASTLHGAGVDRACSAARGCTNEDAYAWAQLAKGVLGTDNVDAQLGDGLPGRGRARPAPRRRSPTATAPRAIVLLGARPQGRAAGPVPAPAARRGRARRAAHRARAGRAPALTRTRPRVAAARCRASALDADVASTRSVARRRARRSTPARSSSVARARPSLAESPARVADAAAAARSRDAARRAVPRRRCAAATCTARSTSASPRLPARPGHARRRPRAGSPTAWGARPDRARASTPTASSRAAADGKIDVLVLLGADPLADFPDRDLAARGARRRADTVIAVDAFLTESSRSADVVLPRDAAGARRPARVTNLEGRVQRVGRKVAPEGTAMDDWRIAAELALRLGADFDLATVDEVTDEIARVAPALAGVDRRAARAGRATASCCRSPSTATRSCCRTRDAVDPRRRRLGHRRGTRSRSRARPPPSDGRGRRRRADAADASAPRAAPAGRPDALRRGTRAVAGRRRRRRATRTLCASWSAARSTTTARSCRDVAVARAARRRAARCASTRATSTASASTPAAEVQGHVARASSQVVAGARRRAACRAGIALHRVHRRRARRRRRSSTRARRSPTCGWRRCDDAIALLALDPLLDAATSTGRCSPSSLIKVVDRVRAPARRR